MKIADVIETFISGDWGNEKPTVDTPNAVKCVRGADIIPITKGEFNEIPTRYISDRSLKEHSLQAGDIIIEKSGGSPTQATGRVVLVTDDLINTKGSIVCTNFCVAFRVKKEWSPYFVYQYWNHVYNHGVFFNFEGKTSGLKNLQLENAINAIEIPTYALVEQERIVAILRCIEKKANLNRQINQNLEAMAKQLYDYWFVQFDFPNEKGKPYKSSGGAMVWSEKLKRNIPTNWEIAELGNTCEILLGGTPDTGNETYWGGSYSWLNSGEVAEFPILKSEKTITEEGLNSSATAYATKGSVTLSITRHLRPSILAIDACINQSVVAIKETDEIRKEYLYPLINREVPRFMTLRTGAQQPHINKETVKSTWMAIPTSDILDKYYTIVSPIYCSIVENAIEVENLIKQRDELLPLLMNGQVSVNSDLSLD
ncbi:MAG: restriction endonuclease subunit S [Lachnospiraceae bacterium]|nr:restriction endonuclease subunit S [Lachnospiraceae bacterium]